MYAGSALPGKGETRSLRAARSARGAVFACAALATAFAGREHGSYDLAIWAPECVAAVAAGFLLFAYGRRPPPTVVAAAGCLMALGAWSALSVRWGGNAEDAVLFLGRGALVAAVLVVGAQLRSGLRGPAIAGVCAGFVLQAAEVLGRIGLGAAPSAWFYARTVDGPVGYHNAQGSIFAVGVALLVPRLASSRAARRATAGAGVVVLLAALLLTQSRGALPAAALGTGLVLLAVRDLRLVVRVLPLAGVGAALLLALRRADVHLAGPDPGANGFGSFLGMSLVLAAAYAGLLALPLRVVQARRILAVCVAATVVAVGGWLHQPLAAAAREAGGQLATDAPPASAIGSTRYASLAPNGRRETWRVGLDVWEANRLAGAGQGAFAREWTVRRATTLYVLQPHSIEVELASELGVVGLGLFAGFVVCAVVALGRLRRLAAAAAAAALVAVLAQASIDWTWSFPGLAAPIAFVVGAAAAGRPRRRRVPGRPATIAAAVAVVALAGGTLLVWQSSRDLARGSRLLASEPRAAAIALDRAHRLDPWNPDVLTAQAQLARSSGELAIAADRYAAAARLSRRPWVALFEQAGVTAALGEHAATVALCRRAAAANPLEPTLTEGQCAAVGPDRQEGVRRAKASFAAPEVR